MTKGKAIHATSLQEVHLPEGTPKEAAVSEMNAASGMYPMSKNPLKKRELKSKYDEVMGSLTLFAPYSYENELELQPVKIELERPVTPVEEEIRSAPTTLSQLQRLVRRRIQPQPNVPCLPEEEQSELAAMIMGEVNAIWPDLREQIEFPFFTEEQNRELNRRLTVHVVTVCHEIFHQYLSKAEVMKKRGVFSEEANMTRMKTQMSLDLRKFLNVLTTRRYISADMKEQSAQEHRTASDVFIYPDLNAPAVQQQPTARKGDEEDEDEESKLTFKRFIALNRRLSEKSRHLMTDDAPPRRGKKHRFKTIAEDLDDLDRNMPDIDTEKLVPLLHNLPKDLLTSSRMGVVSAMSVPDRTETARSMKISTAAGKRTAVSSVPQEKEELEEVKGLRLRTSSVPDLKDAGRLLDEMDIEVEDWFPCKEADERLMRFFESNDQKVPPAKGKIGEKESRLEFTRDGTGVFSNLDRSFINRDLSRLINRGNLTSRKGVEEEENGSEDDLPALIQAMPRVSREENRLAKLKDTLAELQEREQEFLKKEEFRPREPSHPQPAVVDKRLGGQMARLSDVRPPERQCITDVTLSMFGPVWNDLADQIDQATVKHLDRNLFLGEAIREVYREIMKTVSKEHLEFTRDPIVEDCPPDLSLSGMLASSSLHQRRRADRVINPHLHQKQVPPWNEQSLRQWAKPPIFSPGDKKGNLNLESVVDNVMKSMAQQAADLEAQARVRLSMNLGFDMPRPATAQPPKKYVLTLEEFTRSIADAPKVVQDRLVRSYASWLTWWKSTTNSEDYQKFMSTQETDFLALLFHMYDSDTEGDDEEGEASSDGKSRQLVTRELERQKEKERKLQELRAEKTAFQTGLWNPNCILMGGLGNDPVIPAEEEVIETQPQESQISSSRSAKKSFVKKTHSHQESSVLQKSQSMLTDRSARTESSFRSEKTSLSIADPSLTQIQPAVSVVPSQPSTHNTPRMPRKLLPQERLERLWAMLKMPDHQRLDMAIRYSTEALSESFGKALDAWDRAAKVVLEREALIAELEAFERAASDPNRFFVRGHHGSSKARMQEAADRDVLHKRLDAIDDIVREVVQRLENDFQDSLTYQGRPYLDKMKWDRVEMLYWLQEERRRYVAMQTATGGGLLLTAPSPTSPAFTDRAI